MQRIIKNKYAALAIAFLVGLAEELRQKLGDFIDTFTGANERERYVRSLVDLDKPMRFYFFGALFKPNRRLIPDAMYIQVQQEGKRIFFVKVAMFRREVLDVFHDQESVEREMRAVTGGGAGYVVVRGELEIDQEVRDTIQDVAEAAFQEYILVKYGRK